MLLHAIITPLVLGSSAVQTVSPATMGQAVHSVETTAKVEDEIVGLWQAVDAPFRVVIEVVRDTIGYFGRIVYLEEAYHAEGAADGLAGRMKTDRHNPDSALRERPLTGLTIMSGLRFDDGKWKNGRIYSPDNGKSYRAWARMEGDQLRVRGYVKIGFIKVGRSVWFTRLTDPLPPVEQIEIQAEGRADESARLGHASGGL